jgi:hypothetical protein
VSDAPTSAPSTTFARWLFGAAAAFNLGIGFGLLFLRPQLAGVLRLDPIFGTNLVLLYLVAGFILLFGCAYTFVAFDHVRYRPYILLGIVGKLTAFASLFAPWLVGQAPGTLPALASGDLVFAGLFFLFLRRVPAP